MSCHSKSSIVGNGIGSNQKSGLAKTSATRVLAAVLISSILSACATTGMNRTTADGSGPMAPGDPSTAAPGVSPGEQAAIKDTTPATGDLGTATELENIPMDVNRNVLQWIDYFQGRGRPHMERYLSRSSRYMPLMQDILRKEGLPEDLIYIALIESGFSATAHSSASAVGYWQFIRGTGKRYGLAIDSYVDERRDFVKATHAAADYFKGLYNLFGVWYLAIASYNVGENRVKNLVMKYHTRDFWKLARENKLPEETQNYVPKFIAARLIAKDPEKYGFTDIEYMPALEFDEAEFTTSIDIRKLATAMNVEYDDLRDLNPAYKRGVAFEKAGKLVLRVPKGQKDVALAAAGAAAAASKRVYVADEDFGYYRVRRGDTIASIAKKFGTSQRNIMQLNRMGNGTRLVAGKRIRVPSENVGGLTPKNSSERGPSTTALKAMTPGKKKTLALLRAPNPLKSRKVHVVRRGDTLIEIAQKYRISVRDLTKHNNLGRRAKINVGSRLEIP